MDKVFSYINSLILTRFLTFSQDRNIKRKALNEVKSDLSREKNDEIIAKFYRIHLLKPLVLLFEDKIDKHREMAIEIATE
jgi:hypothetical protein